MPLGCARDTGQPFGAYSSFSTLPRSSSTAFPRPPTIKFAKGQQQVKIRKTVALVTLSLPDTPSTSKTLTYSVVRQTQISLDSQVCSPSAIGKLLSTQVGFEVILLDSKCYPIFENATTVELEFWKSTRKVLAASKSSYEKLTGKTFSATIDLVSCEAGSPPVKCKCLPEDVDVTEKIEKVHAGVEKLQTNFDFLGSVAKAFECLMCM